jgi:hypothetical protein
MEEDRIENNASYQKFNKDLKGIEAIKSVAGLLSVFGMKNDKLDDVFRDVTDMKNQYELLAKSPDKFNDFFAKRGWIAHESMNFDFMLTCIDLAEKGQIEIAEMELIEFYTSDKMKWLIHQLKGIPEFEIRYDFFLLAYEDTLAKRYHSVVPLLLMMIDGAVNDIDKGKGFFAENTDLTAWDSIAAHSTGLTVLKGILNDSRKKTNREEISLPFRHGILHGRDLGYANKVVTAKCWAALIAIKDWAGAVKQGKKNPPEIDPEPTLMESLKDLTNSVKEYNEGRKRNELVAKKVEAWIPRKLIIGKDILEKASSTEYTDFMPEQEAIRFAEYWSKNNYGKIAKQIHKFTKAKLDENAEAGKIRKILYNKKLIDYKIIKVVDCSPAISEITLVFNFEMENIIREKEITIRFIYGKENGEILIIGDKNGQWKFLNFLTQLECFID